MELLDARPDWPQLVGFRFVSEDGPWPRYPGAIICTFEGDVPAMFEGKLVAMDVEDRDGWLKLMNIMEIPYPGPLPAPAHDG
jgi:hypothetical protein